jgi:EmrB/QacA subfamily drug resistance transporter
MVRRPAKKQREPIDPDVLRTAYTIIVGALAVVFDTAIVSFATHDLIVDLNAPLSVIQWVSTGYLLSMLLTIPMTNWAQAAIGGKRLWILSLSIFLLGSILCAAAWDAPSLITFRVLEGIGAGMILPLSIGLVVQATAGRNIGAVLGVVTTPIAIGPIVAPLLGGVLLEAAGWRSLFLVNIPFCVFGIFFAFRNLRDDQPMIRARFDLVGLALLSPGIVAVVWALSRVPSAGGFGALEVLGPLGGGLIAIAAFTWWGFSRGPAALVDVQLLKLRTVGLAAALGFLNGASLYGTFFLFPLFWQEARGLGAVAAAVLLIPQGVGALVSRRSAGRMMDRLGVRRILFAGFVVTAVGTAPFAIPGDDLSGILLMAVLLVRGVGIGAVAVALTGAAFVGVRGRDVPSASIIARVVQQAGGSLGIAILAVVLSTDGAQRGIDAFHHAFWWLTGFAAMGIPLCFLLPGRGGGTRPSNHSDTTTLVASDASVGDH